jgi:hypothetical protein
MRTLSASSVLPFASQSALADVAGVSSVHNLSFTSDWGTGQHLLVTFDVAEDKSAVLIWGSATDDNLPITATQIAHVLADGTRIVLASSRTEQCKVTWPASEMIVGQANEILFYMTSSAGMFGASTRISKP